MSLYRGYFLIDSTDPLGLAKDRWCCTFKKHRRVRTGPFKTVKEYFADADNIVSDGTTPHKACKKRAAKKGWDLLRADCNPCRGSGVCNTGQKRNVRVTGMAYWDITAGGNPRDDVTSEMLELEIWVGILGILSSAQGGKDAVGNLANELGNVSIEQIRDAMNNLVNVRKRGRILGGVNLWFRVEGDCCRHGYWSNSYEKHTFWSKCPLSILNGSWTEISRETSKKFAACKARALQEFKCDRTNVGGQLSGVTSK